MGKRGPAKKPTAIRVAEGNPGKRPLPKNEPNPGVVLDVPKPPSFLGADAKRHWKKIVPVLRSSKLLSGLDLDALVAYCNSYEHWVSVVRLMSVDDYRVIVTNRFGEAKINPLVEECRRAQDEMMRWLQEFGMTPAARARVVVADDDDGLEGDAFDKISKMKAG